MTTSKQKLSREQRLIQLIKQITAENLIGDDCAVLPGNRLVSSDMLVEGKHFLLPQMNLADLGWKSMAVNLSDIAAMAGTPEFALVNIALPARLIDEDFNTLYAALAKCAAENGTRIVGGDLTGSDLLVISITVIGSAHATGPRLRSGAKEGDIVIATGDFGASALGLELILRGNKADAEHSHPLRRHLRPQPRLKESQDLANLAAERCISLMDTSDGLADALIQTAMASKLAIELNCENIPIDPSTKEIARELGLDPIELALYGGEDYELLACVPPVLWQELSKFSAAFKSIGCVVKGSGVKMKNSNGSESTIDETKTFQHWNGT